MNKNGVEISKKLKKEQENYNEREREGKKQIQSAKNLILVEYI